MRRLFLLLVFLLLIGISFGVIPQEEKEYAWIILPSGNKIKAEIAATPEERALGLMFREGLEENQGMLLVFERLDFYSIWMKNMKIPLDLIWLNPEGNIVYLLTNVPPCEKDPCPGYQPYQKAQYVLEIAAGKAKQENLKVGSSLKVELPPGYY